MDDILFYSRQFGNLIRAFESQCQSRFELNKETAVPLNDPILHDASLEK